MSALSADYNIYGAVLTNDLYHRLINPEASQRRIAIVGKFCTMLVGGLALLLALGVESMGGAFTVMMTILGMIGGPTTIPILLGLWIRRPAAGAAIAAVASGIVFGALAKWVWGFSYAPFVLGNMAVTAVVFLAWGWLWPARGEMKEKIELLFQRMLSGQGIRQSDEEAVEDEPAGEKEADQVPSPFAIVGVIIGVIGLALGAVGLFSGTGFGVTINGVISLVMLVLAGIMVRFSKSIASN